MHIRPLRILLTAAVLSGLAACNSEIDIRGNRPLPYALAEIKPGQTTKSDVVILIGTPATVSLFSDDHWYYISSRFETYAFFKPKELDREVVAIDFDKGGKVTDLRHLTLADGKPVEMVARETPAPGRELSFLEQMIGNVGRYSKKKDDDSK